MKNTNKKYNIFKLIIGLLDYTKPVNITRAKYNII